MSNKIHDGTRWREMTDEEKAERRERMPVLKAEYEKRLDEEWDALADDVESIKSNGYRWETFRDRAVENAVFSGCSDPKVDTNRKVELAKVYAMLYLAEITRIKE